MDSVPDMQEQAARQGIHPRTREAHRTACCDPVHDWADRSDFEAAAQGLIHRPDDEGIRNADGALIWHHRAFDDLLHGEAPETVHPSLWRHAMLNSYRGLFRVTEGIYQVRGESLANVTFIEGETGYIVIDPLTTVEVAAYALNLLYSHVGKRPVVAVIYSHTHSDHFGGVKGMIDEADVAAGKVRVIAPHGFEKWVLREQGLASEGTPSRNDYMYGERLEIGPRGLVDTGLGQMVEGGQVTFIPPTEEIPETGGRLTIDGVEIDFLFAPGEAPAGMHCYIPAARTLHVADSCYMCLHNVYTIRGALPRDAMQWADSITRSMRFEDAEVLIGGHNWPTFGRDRIRTFLAQQRDGIRYMHDQTLRLMSHGYVPSEIAEAIRLPEALDRLWHLRGYYGALKHNVQGIYAYYLGWYDGNPAHLDRLPPRELARRTLDYMGGIDAVLDRAEADLEAGEFRWVTHILDQVIWAEPTNERARAMAAAAHTELGYGAENATWRNAYLTAAQELREGLPAGRAPARLPRDVLMSMDALMLLDSLSIRLNGPAAANVTLTINWTLKETGQTCHSSLSNAVLIHRRGHDSAAPLGLTLGRQQLGAFALGQLSAKALLGAATRIDGEPDVLQRLDALLDRFPAHFPVASHDPKFGEDLR